MRLPTGNSNNHIVLYYHIIKLCNTPSQSHYQRNLPTNFRSSSGSFRPLAVSGLLAKIDASHHQGVDSDNNDADNNSSNDHGVVSLVKFDCDGGYGYYHACSTGQSVSVIQTHNQPINQSVDST